jgi:hypothetical protein
MAYSTLSNILQRSIRLLTFILQRHVIFILLDTVDFLQPNYSDIPSSFTDNNTDSPGIAGALRNISYQLTSIIRDFHKSLHRDKTCDFKMQLAHEYRDGNIACTFLA